MPLEKEKNRPIGVFDSGIGGLTVANAIRKYLPDERLIYFGDIAHLPYGDKSADAIRYYSLKICKFLLEQRCKMIVIACNSAWSTSHQDLLEFFGDKVLFVNVVDPIVEAVMRGNYKKVGVIATKATIGSDIYFKKLKALDQKIKVSQMATPLLVPMIEEGFHENEISHSIINTYLSSPVISDIDVLLLACTHYPLVKKEIEDYYNHKVTVLDSTDLVANDVKNVLESENLTSDNLENIHKFYVSDYTKSFESTARLFYGQSVDLEVKNIW